MKLSGFASVLALLVCSTLPVRAADLPARNLISRDTLGDPLAGAHELLASGKRAAARIEYARLLQQTNLTTPQRTLVLLRLGQIDASQKNFEAARRSYAGVLAMADVLPHHRWEAEQGIQELMRAEKGLPPRDPAASRVPPPTRPKPALTLYVAPGGADTNAGTRRRPFASLERARDEIRSLKNQGRFNPGGVEVRIRPGTYPVTRSFQLTAQDSGTEAAPIVYRADPGAAVFTGGVRLKTFAPVRDEALLARLPAVARGKVLEIDLPANGVTNIRPLVLGGFASGRGFKSHPVMELYFNDQPLPLARGPAERFCEVAEIPAPEKMNGLTGSRVGHFLCAGDFLSRWAGEPELWLYGYWFYDWADSYEKVAAIDLVKKEVRLAPPYHGYGYRKGQHFYAVNALAELDSPGEWHFDSAHGRICFWPPSAPERATVELSVADFPLVQLQAVSNVAFEGLTWERGCVDAVLVHGGEHCLFAGCTVRGFGGNGIEIAGGREHGLLSCDVHTLGRGGVTLSGGERKTLTPAGHWVENCHIYALSRIDHTYTPAVLCEGVGQHIAHNWFHNIPSSALRVGGNDHLIEFNEISQVVLESDDQGGVDMWGDPAALGNCYRFNFFHHIGNWRHPDSGPACGQAAIRLDDAICGVLIYGNVFYRCGAGKLGFGAIQIHGGKDNILDHNLFAECHWGVSFSPWPEAHWKEFTAARRASPEVDPVLYAKRYPAFGRLDQELNVNWLWRNTTFSGGPFLHRNAGAARLFDNGSASDQPAFFAGAQPAPLFRHQQATDTFEPGLVSEKEIGLYRDAFRKELPPHAPEPKP